MYERSHKLHKYRTMHLFAGGGGGIWSDLLLGHRPICAVENNLYCQQVLSARQEDGSFPWFPIFSDVQEFDGKPWRGLVDVVEGGFPCTDISLAGKGAGIDGEKSGLWREMARIIAEVQPRFVFVENVRALVSRGLGRVLGDLADLGFDAEWDCFRASDVGAPHKRERLFVLAYRPGSRLPWRQDAGASGGDEGEGVRCAEPERGGGAVDNANFDGKIGTGRAQSGVEAGCASVGDPDDQHGNGSGRQRQGWRTEPSDAGGQMANPSNGQLQEPGRRQEGRDGAGPAGAILAHANQQHGDAGGLGAGPICGERRQAPNVSGRMADAPELQQGQGQQFSTRPDSAGSGSPPRSMPRIPWPPGPNDTEGWSAYIAQGGPQPAICRGVARVPDGVNDPLAHRSKRLETLGNAWVPHCAAFAFRILYQRMRLQSG